MARRARNRLGIVLAVTAAMAGSVEASSQTTSPTTTRGSLVAPAPPGRLECRPAATDEVDPLAGPASTTQTLCFGFKHPLMAAAYVPGPVPIYGSLNDRFGRRYVVGETLAIDEGGGSRKQTGILVADRVMRRVDPRLKTSPAPALVQPPKINPDLAAVIAAAGRADTVRVLVDVVSPPSGVQAALDRLIATGGIRSLSAYQAAEDRLVADQRASNGRAVAPVAGAIASLGGRVTAQCANLPCLVAELPASAISSLAARADVVEIDIERQVIEDAMTGSEIRTGAQLRQFLDTPFDFDGNGVNETYESDNIMVAVIEAGGGFPDHEGYREALNSFFRYGTGTDSTGKWECDANGCTSVTSFSSLSSHAAGVAGLVMGDLTDGQIPSYPAAAREGASGYAPEARAHLYWFSAGQASAELAFDHIAGLTSAQKPPDLVSNSWSYIEGPECSGASSISRSANRLFLDGTAVFKSAGNRGGTATSCKIGAPGSAVGVFTVGAHMRLTAAGISAADANTYRTAPIYDDFSGLASSWGGNSTEGQNRSIVSITGPGTRTPEFTANGGIGESVCCTSMAAPTVAGAAADFMDFYRNASGNFIDNPGVLYSNMLLMGDRQTVTGKTTSTPDSRWGTGRLRMRKFDANGLDAPAAYYTGWTCVSNGETVKLPVLDGAVLPTDMDVIKASAYWYDRRHDGSDGSGNTGKVADVDLAIVNAANDIPVVTDYDASDNKARVLAQNVGGRRMNVELSGFDVAGHSDPTCGSNAIQVFFSFFAEDSDREAPTYDPSTGAGIFPENT